MNPEIERCLGQAVRFRPSHPRFGRGRPIRVASTLLTCSTAAAVLNDMGIPAEAESAYSHINVHNPGCPLFFDATQGAWVCAAALANHPVWGINWAGARMICQRMGARLPLQTEWECFASNNDLDRIYPWGNAPPTHLLANFGEHFGGTSDVCSFPPSDLGLYDLAGNLSEWCHDSFETGSGATTPFERVVKGGAWSKDAHFLQIMMTRGKWERLGTTTIGFRPVWED